MDFVILLLFLYIAHCCKPCSEGDLSSRALLPLRGLCAVGIIFHHVTQNISCDGTLLFKYFDFTGGIFVSVFFMLSGYALSAQYDAKGNTYLKGFLKKRLTSLLLPYFVFYLVYFLMDLMLGNPLSNTSGTVLYSWYVKAITFLYILYYLAQRFSQGKSIRFWLLLGAGLIGYILFCRIHSYGIWWYGSVLAFPFGMLYYRLHWSGKAGKPLASFAVSLTVFSIVLVLRLKIFTDEIPGLLLGAVISLTFPLTLFSFLRRFSIRSRVLNYLGSRSYEIYLAQGIPITVIRSGLVEVNTPLAFCAITLTGTLLIAEAVYRLDRRLFKLIPAKKACC